MNTLISILTTAIVLIFAVVIIKEFSENNTITKGKKILSYITSSLLIVLVTIQSILLFFNSGTKTEIKTSEEVLQEARKDLSKEFPNKVYNPDLNKVTVKQEFTKQSALDSLTEILNLYYDKDNSKSAEERFNFLIESPEKYEEVISKDALSRTHLVDTFATPEMYSNTGTALLNFMGTLLKVNNTDVVQPGTINLDHIYLDEKANSAYVPFNIYTGNGTSVGIQLVFVDGLWKISPYTFVQSVSISNQIIKNMESEKQQ